jgi:hypothetical protein
MFDCMYGGMCRFLVWGCPKGPDPDTAVLFTAPGFKQQSVQLMGKRPDAQGCYRIDVVLEPE